jgi:hypothetical protein
VSGGTDMGGDTELWADQRATQQAVKWADPWAERWAERWSIVSEVAGAGCCAHPVRLAGNRVDASTGEIGATSITVACKDRRMAVCTSCSTLYRKDAWHLVSAGLRGGKGVPETVGAHPRLFVTLTAPGFGAVHSRSVARDGRARLCHPRRSPAPCPHGVILACFERHGSDDERVGTPICAACFDYRGAVLWNAHGSLLFQRTRERIVRELSRLGSVPVRHARDVFRLSYVKVAEFQRRGLVHFHIVVRADGPEGPSFLPPEWLDAGRLAEAVTCAVGSASVAGMAGVGGAGARFAWGSELDVRDLGASGADIEAVAAYAAKYATKSADGEGALAHRIRSQREIESLGVNRHLRRMVDTAWGLGNDPDLAPLRLHDHAHNLGYRGHFATKSTRYSTTFSKLRQARAEFVKGQVETPAETPEETTAEFDGHWHYAGRGYRQAGAERLAEALIAAGSDLDEQRSWH